MNRKEMLAVALLVVAVPVAMVLYLMHSSGQGAHVPANGSTVPGAPRIWYCNRVFIFTSTDENVPFHALKIFLTPDANLEKLGKPINPFPVEYSCRPDVGRCFHEGKVCFSHAVEGNGWVVEWGMYYCDSEKPVNVRCRAPTTCAVYFTGIGCPHCALTDPYLFYAVVPHSRVALVEYEIYKDAAENAKVFQHYVEMYHTEPGVPQIIFDENSIILGDMPIVREVNTYVSGHRCISVGWLKSFVHG